MAQWSTNAARYLKCLPIPSIPTLYRDSELAAFRGTTLVPAVGAKLRKLRREFDTLKRLTRNLKWIADIWWGESLYSVQFDNEDEDEENDGLVQFEDWIILDGMYRSRALEWPGQGEAMVPGVDMANHRVPANAIYEMHDGNGHLVLAEDATVKAGDEVFISYGDGKSAVEMLFSYGFIPQEMAYTQSILISLPSPHSDPLGPAKAALASQENCTPGIRLFPQDGTIRWNSEVLWLMIVNEEDGLDFKVLNRLDDKMELSAFWKDERVVLVDFHQMLEKEEMYSLYRLRATVVVLGQVEAQLEKLNEFEAGSFQDVDPSLERLAKELRAMEKKLLEDAVPVLHKEASQHSFVILLTHNREMNSCFRNQ
jgi:hypothetical protein